MLIPRRKLSRLFASPFLLPRKRHGKWKQPEKRGEERRPGFFGALTLRWTLLSVSQQIVDDYASRTLPTSPHRFFLSSLYSPHTLVFFAHPQCTSSLFFFCKKKIITWDNSQIFNCPEKKNQGVCAHIILWRPHHSCRL